MNLAEGISREIQRVSTLRAEGRENLGYFVKSSMLLEAVHEAVGGGDAVELVRVFKALKRVDETEQSLHDIVEKED